METRKNPREIFRKFAVAFPLYSLPFTSDSGVKASGSRSPTLVTNPFTSEVRQNHWKIAELDQHLAAGAAGRGRRAGISDYGEAFDSLATRGHRCRHGVPLGAHAETVGSVFDIAAHMHATLRVEDRGSHREVRVRRVRFLPHLRGSFNRRSMVSGLKSGMKQLYR